jgi:PAS domain S-box-containing protein
VRGTAQNAGMSVVPGESPPQQDLSLLRADAGSGGEHQRMLALLIRTTEQGIWFIDNQLRTTDANPAMCRILGLPLQEIVGRDIYSFVDEANAEIFREHVRRRAAGVAEAYEIALRRPDGTLVPCWNNATPVYDAGGRKIGAVGMFSDISALKRTEHELRDAHRRLAEQSRLLHSTLQGLRQGVLSVDADQRVNLWNPRLLELIQVPESLLARRPSVAEVARWQIDHGHFSEADLERFQAGGLRTAQYRRRRPDGVVLDIESHASPDGSFVRTFTDVTEQVRAEEALIAARDEAERANRAKNEFLSRMSHELRTPLNAVLGFAQLMQSDNAEPLGPAQRNRLHELQRGARHLLALINDVLDLSRIEAGSLPLTLSAVDVAAAVEECLPLVQATADARGLRMEQRAPAAGAPPVRADPVRLKQVLLNLLSNAVKYTPAGGQVWVTWRASDQQVHIEVGDTGPGLAPQQQERLFQPFERLDAARSGIDGAGIGLALSKWLVDLMNGELGVDSAPGSGSRFWLRLAVADGQALARPGAAADASAWGGLPPPAAALRRRVLYVEDNEVNRLLMQGMLGRHPGVDLGLAERPEDALAMAGRAAPDLVLLDIQLPGIDGFELLRRLRAMPAMAGVPVVAVSANAMPEDRARAMAAGFDDYVTKPIDMPLLLATVERWLR